NQKSLLQVREGVINAYGGVLVSQESIRILESNLKTINSNLRETKAMYENGFAEAEDVEQLQITSAQISNELNNAKRLEGISKQMFNLSLGIAVDANVVLEDNLKSLAEQSTAMLVQQQEFNFENNVDYRIARNLTRQRELEVQLEKSKALPRLSGFVNYGTTAFDNEFVFFDSETPWYQSSIFGLSMEVPIFSSLGRSARTQQAKIALDQAKTDLKQATQQIRLELDRARSNFEYAIENYRTSEKNLNLAQSI